MSDEKAVPESRSTKWFYAGLAALALAGFGLAYYLNVPYLESRGATDLGEYNVREFEQAQIEYEAVEGSDAKVAQWKALTAGDTETE